MGTPPRTVLPPVVEPLAEAFEGMTIDEGEYNYEESDSAEDA